MKGGGSGLGKRQISYPDCATNESRFKELYEQGGELALQEISRKKPCPLNRVEEHVEKAVVEFAFEKPAYGQLRTSNELKKRGVFVSPGGVYAPYGCAMTWRPFASGSRPLKLR